MFTLLVEGMTCGGCARRITTAVQAVDKAAAVEVDLPARLIRVVSAEDAEIVARAVTAAGYPASVRPAAPA
ncbi:heavy-metal-associated domain-containing protein [Noviherbaspirillum aerium]|uniref:heavy-metal-associated domain-containing protein n=1 Tax=Noviherbaspirillum aerium TaxID=2588497 RepID=UPI00124DE78A|nr:heavy-metal-associated domain-containing protein [Noviherbaspirillum aerium]